MNTGRKDYDKAIKDDGGIIGENEPVFILRAQDEFAAETLRQYAAIAQARGASPELVASVHARIVAFEAFPERKKPDLPSKKNIKARGEVIIDETV